MTGIRLIVGPRLGFELKEASTTVRGGSVQHHGDKDGVLFVVERAYSSVDASPPVRLSKQGESCQPTAKRHQ
jgi:hypothetical protein